MALDLSSLEALLMPDSSKNDGRTSTTPEAIRWGTVAVDGQNEGDTLAVLLDGESGFVYPSDSLTVAREGDRVQVRIKDTRATIMGTAGNAPLADALTSVADVDAKLAEVSDEFDAAMDDADAKFRQAAQDMAVAQADIAQAKKDIETAQAKTVEVSQDVEALTQDVLRNTSGLENMLDYVDSRAYGGRNYVRNSGTYEGWYVAKPRVVLDGEVATWTEDHTGLYTLQQRPLLPISLIWGKTVTISWEARLAPDVELSATSALIYGEFDLWHEGGTARYSSCNSSIRNTTLTSEWTKITKVWTWEQILAKGVLETDTFNWRFSHRYKGIQVRHPMLEVGNMALDWTPAPEDAESALSASEVRVLAAQAEAIAESEQMAAAKYALQRELADTTARVDAIPSQIAVLNTKAAAAETRLASAESSLSSAEASIASSQAKIEQLFQLAGGSQNYIRNSYDMKDWTVPGRITISEDASGCKVATWAATAVGGNLRSGPTVPYGPLKGQKVTLSMWLRCGDTLPTYLQCGIYLGNTSTFKSLKFVNKFVANEWVRASMTVSLTGGVWDTADDDTELWVYFNSAASSAVSFEMKLPKLEIGETMTAWTAHPADDSDSFAALKEELATVSSRVTTAQTAANKAASDLTAAKKDLQAQITATNKDVATALTGGVSIDRLVVTDNAKFKAAVIDALIADKAFVEDMLASQIIVAGDDLAPDLINVDLWTVQNGAKIASGFSTSSTTPTGWGITLPDTASTYVLAAGPIRRLTAGTTYKYAFKARNSNAAVGGILSVFLRWWDASDKKTDMNIGASSLSLTTSYKRFEGTFTVPVGAVRGQIIVRKGNQAAGSSYSIFVVQTSCVPANGATRILPGEIATGLLAANAVTAEKIQAESVAGAVGQFIELQAEQVTTPLLNADKGVFQTLAGKTAEFIKLTAGQVTTPLLTAKDAFFEQLAGKTGKFIELTASQVIATKVGADSTFTDQLLANQAYIKGLYANKILISSGDEINNDAYYDSGATYLTAMGSSSIVAGGFGGHANAMLLPQLDDGTSTSTWGGNTQVGYRPTVEGGREYTITTWVKADSTLRTGGSGLCIRVYWRQADGSNASTNYNDCNIISPTVLNQNVGTWIKSEATVTAPANATVILVRPGLLYTAGSTGGGAVRVGMIGVRRRVGSTLIEDGSITTGKLTADAVNANYLIGAGVAADTIFGKQLAANTALIDTLVTSRLVVQPDNLFPSLVDSTAWTLTKGQVVLEEDSTSPSGMRLSFADRAKAYAEAYGPYVTNVVPGTKYWISFYVKRSTATGAQIQGLIRCDKADGSKVDVKAFPATDVLMNNYVQYYYAAATIPEGTVRARAIIRTMNNSNGSNARIYVHTPTCRPQASTVLIEDGAITADKITTNKLNAADVIATGTITGGLIQGNSINAKDSLTVGATTTGTGYGVFADGFKAVGSTGTGLWINATKGLVFGSYASPTVWLDMQGNATFKGKIMASTIEGSTITGTTIQSTNTTTKTGIVIDNSGGIAAGPLSSPNFMVQGTDGRVYMKNTSYVETLIGNSSTMEEINVGKAQQWVFNYGSKAIANFGYSHAPWTQIKPDTLVMWSDANGTNAVCKLHATPQGQVDLTSGAGGKITINSTELLLQFNANNYITLRNGYLQVVVNGTTVAQSTKSGNSTYLSIKTS